MDEEKSGLPAWSIKVGQIGSHGRDMEFSASRAECAAIAKAYGLRAVNALTVRVHLAPTAGAGVRMTGRLVAEVVQACVVSLDLVTETIEEDVRRTFVPGEVLAHHNETEKVAPEILVLLDEEEEPVPLVSGSLMLAPVLLEQFALGINPYPRRPDLPEPSAGEAVQDAEKTGPFAALARLRGKDQSEDN